MWIKFTFKDTGMQTAPLFFALTCRPLLQEQLELEFMHLQSMQKDHGLLGTTCDFLRLVPWLFLDKSPCRIVTYLLIHLYLLEIEFLRRKWKEHLILLLNMTHWSNFSVVCVKGDAWGNLRWGIMTRLREMRTMEVYTTLRRFTVSGGSEVLEMILLS